MRFSPNLSWYIDTDKVIINFNDESGYYEVFKA